MRVNLHAEDALHSTINENVLSSYSSLHEIIWLMGTYWKTEDAGVLVVKMVCQRGASLGVWFSKMAPQMDRQRGVRCHLLGSWPSLYACFISSCGLAA